MLEEFGPHFRHVAGENNVVADTLSRHPKEEELIEEDESETSVLQYEESYLVTKDDIAAEVFPLSPRVVSKYQLKDIELQDKAINDPKTYVRTIIEGTNVITKNGKIVIPIPLQERLVEAYHELLQHPGETRMEATIRHVFDWKGLRETVHQFCKTCHICQLTKKQRKKYGYVPAREADIIPWKRVNVDVIGPYTIRTPTKTHQLYAMTMIDPATGWFEIAPLDKPDSYECQKALDAYWLARYPRPQELGSDNGIHFKKYFAELLNNYGLTRKISLEYNPQSNGIIERVHQVLANVLRTFELEKEELEGPNKWEPFLTAAAYAIRSTHHTTLGASPVQLVFGRDMFLPMKFVADWALIQLRKQSVINKSNRRENQSRIAYEYQKGDKVLIHTPGKLPKLRVPRKGPFEVVNVHNNGTVTIKDGPVLQRINIRRIQPYWQKNAEHSIGKRMP